MTSIIPFLLLVVGIPFFFCAWFGIEIIPLAKELTEEQRQARRKMMICGAVCLTIALSLLAIIPMLPIGQAERMFLITIWTIPYVIALLCCNCWIHRHSYRNLSSKEKWGIALSAVVLAVSLICIVLMAFRGYNSQVDSKRKIQEMQQQLLEPPHIEPPPTETIEERIKRLEAEMPPQRVKSD